MCTWKYFIMKKILVLFLLFIGVSQIMAQVELRPRIGGSYSRLSEDPGSFQQSGRPGFQAGADLMIGNRFFIMPGIEYQKFSYELRQRGTPPPDEDISVIHGLRIPVYMGARLLYPSYKSLLNINLYTGPSLSFITKADIKGDNIFVDKDDFNDRIWGWNVGAMVDILVFYVQAGYEFGLSPVYKVDNSEATNRMFYVNFGIRARF